MSSKAIILHHMELCNWCHTTVKLRYRIHACVRLTARWTITETKPYVQVSICKSIHVYILILIGSLSSSNNNTNVFIRLHRYWFFTVFRSQWCTISISSHILAQLTDVSWHIHTSINWIIIGSLLDNNCHCLSQSWPIVIRTVMNSLKWNWNRNTIICPQLNRFANVCEISDIWCKPQCALTLFTLFAIEWRPSLTAL